MTGDTAVDEMKRKGTIIKGVGGFYYVKLAEGKKQPGEGAPADAGVPASGIPLPEERVIECKARGIFRKERITPLVGDLVEITVLSEEDSAGIIDRIEPRKNAFIRPPIANVDCMVTVIAASRPAPNLRILDQFLVMAEQNDTEAVVCINKADLAEQELLERLLEIYRPIYPTVCTSGKAGEGISELRGFLSGKKCALSGPSGVGKSTLLNRLIAASGGPVSGGNSGLEGETMLTGAVSEKTSRGRHTTRHVELFDLGDGGMLFDTPGFTSFDILETEEEELQYCYPEWETLLGQCRYDNCRHLKEPGCAVRRAIEEGDIPSSRYQSYEAQMKEIQEKRKY